MDIVIIGGGAAGLATAAELGRLGLRAIVLDAASEIAASWTRHYDSLHLHTSKERSALPGLEMPKDWPRYASRDQMVRYLRDYVRHHDINLRLATRVSAVRPDGDRWRVETDGATLTADAVIFATGQTAQPNLPDWPGLDSFQGTVLHSSEYRDGAPFAGQRVLVVGLGNSGGDMVIDLVRAGAQVDVAVRSPVNILPKELLGVPITSLGLLRKLFSPAIADALTAPVVRAVIGRPEDYGLRQAAKGPIRQVIEDARIPLIDVGALPLIKEGRVTPRNGPVSVDGATVHFDGGHSADYDALVLATGYRFDLRAMLPDTPDPLDDRGHPCRCGAPPDVPGLYFCSYRASPGGQLRQSSIEATAIATDIAQKARVPA